MAINVENSHVSLFQCSCNFERSLMNCCNLRITCMRIKSNAMLDVDYVYIDTSVTHQHKTSLFFKHPTFSVSFFLLFDHMVAFGILDFFLLRSHGSLRYPKNKLKMWTDNPQEKEGRLGRPPLSLEIHQAPLPPQSDLLPHHYVGFLEASQITLALRCIINIKLPSMRHQESGLSHLGFKNQNQCQIAARRYRKHLFCCYLVIV